jgi:hypothetical protein
MLRFECVMIAFFQIETKAVTTGWLNSTIAGSGKLGSQFTASRKFSFPLATELFRVD